LRRALDDYRSGGGDFADYVIARQNERAGCETTITLDRPLRAASSFRLL
jgi:predicted nucleic-acid-binding protein